MNGQLRRSVVDNWWAGNVPLEGDVSWMYLDTKGYATTGMGNLIDPVGLALSLPWRHGAGGPIASTEEITAAWNRVKAATYLASAGSEAARSVTDLRLAQSDITSLVKAKLDSFAANLVETPDFADLYEWPAPAQYGLCSMAWAMGPWFATGGKWPHFRAACAGRDWTEAALQCAMAEDAPRNAFNKALFLQAAAGGDPDALTIPPV